MTNIPKKQIPKSVNMSKSRYVQGGSTTVDSVSAGWWERRIFTTSVDDISFVLTPRESTRPDIVASDVYGSTSLTWLVLQYNNIVDINTEFVTGKEIRLPSKRRVSLDFLTRPTGGNRS